MIGTCSTRFLYLLRPYEEWCPARARRALRLVASSIPNVAKMDPSHHRSITFEQFRFLPVPFISFCASFIPAEKAPHPFYCIPGTSTSPLFPHEWYGSSGERTFRTRFPPNWRRWSKGKIFSKSTSQSIFISKTCLKLTEEEQKATEKWNEAR